MRTIQSYYPDVAVSYCKDHDSNNEGLGPHWCPKHNRIIIDIRLGTPDPDLTIEEVTEQIINHETAHWTITRLEGEDTSTQYDDGLYDWQNGFRPRIDGLSKHERIALGV